jgi:hypothetical protein
LKRRTIEAQQEANKPTSQQVNNRPTSQQARQTNKQANKPLQAAGQQANKPTSQQANKPTSQQANKPTSRYLIYHSEQTIAVFQVAGLSL